MSRRVIKIRGETEATFLAAAKALRPDLAELFKPEVRFIRDPRDAWLMVLALTPPWEAEPVYDADGELVTPGVREPGFLVDIYAYDLTQVGGLLTQLAAAGLSATVVSPKNPVHAFA